MSAMNMNLENFNEMVIRDKKTAVVELYAPWCSYCRRIGPAYDRIAASRDDLVLGKINTDEYHDIVKEYGIEAIPTFLFFRDGKVVASVVAPESKAKLEQFIDENLGG